MKKIANIVLNDFTNDSRVWKVSKSLSGLGYEPVVVAMHNDGLEEREALAGVDVNRIKLFTRPWPKWKPVQFLKYLEFVIRASFRYRKSDLVHCNDLNALPIGLLIKFFGRNVKVVYDCHEYETEVNGIGGVEKHAKKWLERFLINYADQIITVSESIANEYSRLYAIPKPHIVLNCPPYIDLPKFDLFRENLGIRMGQKIFLYQGGLSNGRGIELLLEAFSNNMESDEHVLVLMGYGPLEEVVREKAAESQAIFFHPAVAPSSLLKYTSSADYGILFYEDSCLNHRYCSPNKIFEYLMAGIPVITSNLVEMRRLVETEEVGVVAEHNTVGGFHQAVISSVSQQYIMIQNNVLEARKKYCWEEQEKVLKEVYRAL